MYQYLFSAFVILLVYLLTRKRDPRLPPGLYGWPVIGCLPLFQVPSPEDVEEKRKKFGDIFMWRVGIQKNVYLCNPTLIRQAFKSPYLLDRPEQLFTLDSLCDFKKRGILVSNGPHWEAQRKIWSRLLKDGSKSSLEAIVHREAELLLGAFKSHFAHGPALIPSAVTAATIGVICKLASDIEFEVGDETLAKLVKSVTLHLPLLQSRVIYYDLYPWLLHFTPTFVLNSLGFAELQRIRQTVKDYVKGVVAKKKETLNEDDPTALIDWYLVEMKKTENSHLTEEDLIAVLTELVFGGGDDQSSLLRWGIQIIACNPETQNKIQEEIDSVVPPDRFPSLLDKPNLPYTEAAMYEIMRIATISPLGLYRVASQDMMIEQYFIPKGTYVLPFVQKCHTDPQYWKRPNEFYPENFLDSDGKFIPFNEAFLPFTTGRRACIGEHLSKMETFLFMSSFLQKFSFRVDKEEKSSADKSAGSIIFNLPPNLNLIVKERKSEA